MRQGKTKSSYMCENVLMVGGKGEMEKKETEMKDGKKKRRYGSYMRI